jgi:hypothetical protein
MSAPATINAKITAAAGVNTLLQFAETGNASNGPNINVSAVPMRFAVINKKAVDVSAGVGYVISAAVSNVIGSRGMRVAPRTHHAIRTSAVLSGLFTKRANTAAAADSSMSAF